jgi:hypothetical protein
MEASMTGIRNALPALISLTLAAILTASPAGAAADQVPVIDIGPTCGGAETTAAGFGRGEDVCRRAEAAARDELVKQWHDFPSADRGRCMRLATMTDIASYVQVLTCLEMAREARNLGRRDRSTVGSGQ